ncbi:DUF1190 domain-containing protein [Methylobacterium sp. J-068]|uniref:DUF1190 domain-containing protein n=1 Tax=Methylobacterium sp. J-068 TaxID=2836649 RepID=UPI001FB89D34|nr:DUF1190 domain-containing protein [Methylobacterium sp. J-068]MCJ2034555.1 DUF1190 domain-containing protein [Methylobacterium sp. J-068]
MDEGGRSKRSQVVTLVMLGGAGIAALELARVDPSQRMEDVRIYPDAEACVAAWVRTEAECRADYAAARRTYAEAAPTYPSKDLCEAQHGVGECRSADPGDRFVPFMAAYVVGATAAQKLDPQPLFRAASGTSDVRGFGAFAQPGYRTSWGCPVNPAGGSSSAARVPPASVRPALFGGFGATGRAVCGDDGAAQGGGG